MDPELLLVFCRILMLATLIGIVIRWIFWAHKRAKNKFLFGFYGVLTCILGFGIAVLFLALLFIDEQLFQSITLYEQSAIIMTTILAAVVAASELVLFLLHRRFSRKEEITVLNEIGQNPD